MSNYGSNHLQITCNMTTLKLYLDTRAARDGMPAPLKVSITKHTRSALLPLGIKLLPSQWDAARQIVVKRPDKAKLNAYITNRMSKINDILRQLILDEIAPTLGATQLKNRIAQELDHRHYLETTFGELYDFAYKESVKSKLPFLVKVRTSLLAYDANLMNRPVAELNNKWLSGWLQSISYLAVTTQRSYTFILYYIFNLAMNSERIAKLPFRKIVIKPAVTRKRALSLEQMRTIFTHQSSAPILRESLDFFKLSFLLCGINAQDLLCAKMSDIQYNRLEYNRKKTKRHYSIKIEPEAMEIIHKYTDGEMIFRHNPRANIINIYTYYNRIVQAHAEELHLPSDITTYWLRHTWATIAAELDIPKDVIALALGHGASSVTDIYINPDLRKIDDANRRIIEYIKNY